MDCVHGISCFSFNSDSSQLALATNNSLILIYKVSPTSWELQYTLKEHNQHVSAVDWHPTTNRILSCSHDRNVVVWEFTDSWKPNLVNFSQTRGVLDCKWNERGDKYVVGTGSKLIGIGRTTTILKGWNTEKFKCLKSSVTCVRFDPTGHVVAAGSTDNTCIVLTTFIEEVDGKHIAEGRFRDIRTKGEILYTIEAGSWVNALTWSPDAGYLVIVSHMSGILFSDLTRHVRKEWTGRPFLTVEWVKDGVLCGGYDNTPVRFRVEGEGERIEVFEEEKESELSTVQASRRQFEKAREREKLQTIHKNFITCLRRFRDGIASGDILGAFVVWQIID